MNFQFSFKHMDSSDALKNYATDKLGEKISKFVTKAIEAKVTFSVDKHEHTAHCVLKAGDGFNVEVTHSSNDMYASVDKMSDKLTTQLKRHKEKLKDHRHVSANKSMAPEAPEEEVEAVDAGDIVKLEGAKP